ncbi:hypothetical protein HCTV-16_gp157 [Haloarcula virus HCTV-16]|nr:hypothetical protein HCTV-16_gp157 [Haloarcula virus HCTV-16]
MTINEVPVYEDIYELGSREPVDEQVSEYVPATDFWNENRRREFWHRRLRW